MCRLWVAVAKASVLIQAQSQTCPSNWHIDLLCEYLEAVTAGEIRQLLINKPPRSMKSLLGQAPRHCSSP